MNYSKEFKEEALKLSDEIGLKKAAAQLSSASNTTRSPIGAASARNS